MRIVKVGESYICPVCGKYTFEYAGDFDICPVCNWRMIFASSKTRMKKTVPTT